MDLHGISQAADDLVLESEVTSHAYYDKVLHRPEYPGGASGVTWGIGYDGGQSSVGTIEADWKDLVPSSVLAAMKRCAGVTGARARALLPQVKNLIDVPGAGAMQVFADRDIPKYLGLCRSCLPNFDMLSPDCKGSLFSLVYNRGASFDAADDRYAEMRNIKAHMAAKEFAKIPEEIRHMKRLWGKDLSGLWVRRDKEAALFERGLAEIGGAPAPPPALPTVRGRHARRRRARAQPPQNAQPAHGRTLWDLLISFVLHHAA